jgi:hypothetical protein
MGNRCPFLKSLQHFNFWIRGTCILPGGNGTAMVIGNIGRLLFLMSVVPYVVAMVLAFQVQKELHRQQHIKEGPWHVIVAALILNPYVLGFYVPLSVSIKAAGTKRQLGMADKGGGTRD